MNQFIVSKEIEFDAGHRVPLHESKCRNPHGHRYKVVAHVAGALHERGSATGMVMDFSDIKLALTELVHDVFDHGFIVHAEDTIMRDALECGQEWKVIVVEWTPTAEEMARAIYEILRRHIGGLVAVDVYETPTSKATYPYTGGQPA